MMKISHIVSADLLNIIEDRDFYMCLANIANKNSDYLEFYKRKSEEGKFILMDNGAAEGEQLDLPTMLKMINIIHPTEVILNDCLFDKYTTIANSLNSLKFYRDNGYEGRVMYVPQGRTMEEWFDCLIAIDLKDIDTIGIAKHLVRTLNDATARHTLCRIVSSFNQLNKDIHLLGCKDNIDEVVQIMKDFPNVRSCDTALAYVYSKNEEKISDGLERPHIEIDYLNSNFTAKQKQLLDINIGYIDSLVQEKEDI